MAEGQTPLLDLQNIRKEFPGTLANDDVSLQIQPGEIHALLGENGAGKSTLVKIIYGVLAADAGTLSWNGQQVSIPNPASARALGVGMVFQHFSLFEALTVQENIALGLPASFSKGNLTQKIVDVSQSYGLPLDPRRDVHSLSVGERQRIEIVRCLLQEPKLLIMDEPTSVLTPQEADKLFETLRKLSDEGCAILYISHRLEEIRALCHKATIMRLGKVVAECDPAQETARSIAEMMMGENLVLPEKSEEMKLGPARFGVKNLSLISDEQFGVDLKDISFTAHSGEILGIAGLAGNGQTELAAVLSGEVRAPEAGSIVFEDEAVGWLGAGARRRKGLAFVPEERMGHGAVPDMTLWENAFLSGMHQQALLNNGFIQVGKSTDYAKDIVSKFNVKTAGVEHNASSLSGGNLQKFIMGREMLQEPKVLIATQPTWGVDAGSAAAIHQALLDLAGRGCAVVVISQDLDELFAISSWIGVLSEGRLSDLAPVEDITVEEVGLLMGGLHDLSDDAAEAAHV